MLYSMCAGRELVWSVVIILPMCQDGEISRSSEKSKIAVGSKFHRNKFLRTRKNIVLFEMMYIEISYLREVFESSNLEDWKYT